MLFICTNLICKTGFAQTEPKWLKQEKVQNGNWDYYIEKVIDNRSQGQLFANLYYVDGSGKMKTYSADISKNTISNFMINGLPRNTEGRPLNIRILDCMIRESDQRTFVSGEVTLKVQFEFEKDWGIQPLTTYNINIKYTRSFHNLESVEAALRKALVNSLKYIHSWVQKESATNILLAKGLKLSIRNYQEQDADTVYYQKARSISFNDFQAKPPQNSRFQAAIFPSFGYDLKRELRGGLIHLDLILKVYMIKSASWAFPMIKSNYSLNHEQRHFDLVKLISERFKSKLLSEKLNPDNYEGIINFEYLEYYREMNRLQERYDQETNHGSNKAMQDEWNLWIDSQLNAKYSAGSD
jgi:hypothetical protein